MLGMREPSNIASSPDHTLSIGMQKSGPELVSYPDPSLLSCLFLCVCVEKESKLRETAKTLHSCPKVTAIGRKLLRECVVTQNTMWMLCR